MRILVGLLLANFGRPHENTRTSRWEIPALVAAVNDGSCSLDLLNIFFREGLIF